MKKLKKQLEQLRKQSAPATGFKSALWAELDYEFEKIHPRPSFSLSKFLIAPVSSLAVMALLLTSAFAYASPSVNSNHILYPAKIALEKAESVFYRTPEAKEIYFAKILDRRVEETQLLIEQTKQFAYVDLDYISEEYSKVLIAGSRSESANEAIAYLKTSNVRYLHIMREAIIDEIDGLTAEEVVGVITALQNRGMTVTSVPAKEHLSSENTEINPMPFVSTNQSPLTTTKITEQATTDTEIKVQMITDKLDEVRGKIIDSELTEGEKRSLLAEFEQRLLEKYIEIEPELVDDAILIESIEPKLSPSPSFRSEIIKY